MDERLHRKIVDRPRLASNPHLAETPNLWLYFVFVTGFSWNEIVVLIDSHYSRRVGGSANVMAG